MQVVAGTMFESDQEIAGFFKAQGAEDISINVLGLDFVARSCEDMAETQIVAWFVAFRKGLG